MLSLGSGIIHTAKTTVGLRGRSDSLVGLVSRKFGGHLVSLFRKGDFAVVISKIEKSPYRSDPNLLILKSLSERALSEEYRIRSELTLQQSEYFAKQDLTRRSELGICPSPPQANLGSVDNSFNQINESSKKMNEQKANHPQIGALLIQPNLAIQLF